MQKAELNILNFGQVKAILIFVKIFQYFVSLDKNRYNSVILKDFVDPHHTDLEKAASGASGACGHFVGNHAIFMRF